MLFRSDGEDIVANEPAGKAVAVISTNTNKSHNQFSLLATGGNLQLQSLRIVYGDIGDGVAGGSGITDWEDVEGGEIILS